ncbi:MAG TPA: RNA-binding domain-containing protein [Solirubrobacteraceae bacterium]|nr:RNA-binding domain-containing protein [Solirubrobacteraceae bacterium]
MRTVRFANQPSDLFGPVRIRRRRDFEVEGAGFFEASDDVLMAPLAVVKDASLTSLRHAVGRYNRHVGTDQDPLTLLISEDHPESFDPEMTVFLNTSLRVSPSTVRVVVERTTHDLLTREPVARLLRPLLARCRGTLASVMPIESPRYDAIQVEITIPTRGRTISDALNLGADVERLLGAAFATGPLRPATVGELLRTGHHDVLIGQPETEWLDVKDRPYHLDEHGSFMLARDIAAFANSSGGLIAIGLRTTKVRGQDIITKARPVPVGDLNIAKHHAVVRNWIYPRPTGVRFDLALTQHDPDYGIVTIEIPAQPEALKPFFVRRAQFAGRLRSEHLALPVRLGADTSHWDLAELHSLIVAGRAALAQTQAPGAQDHEDEPG